MPDAASFRSPAFDHARYTVSLTLGVKRDRVRWLSDNAAKRKRFFCEKLANVSAGGSRVNEALPSSSRDDKLAKGSECALISAMFFFGCTMSATW